MTIPRNLSFLAEGASSTGVLGTANGGTALTSFTANGILYASSSSVLATGSGLQFDGTNLAIGITPASWYATNSRAFQVGSSTSIFDYSASGNRQTGLLNNAYLNASGVYTYLNTDPASRYHQTGGQHYWYTAPSSSGAITWTQSLFISNAGGVSIGNTTDPGATNLSVTGTVATGGVLLGTSTTAMTDYQEGSFTPTIIGTITAGTGTYTTQSGYYTKIGRQVTVNISLAWTAHTGTGNMNISGLPFTIANTNNPIGNIIAYDVALTALNILICRGTTNSTQINLLQSPVGGGAWATVPLDTNVTAVQVTLTYFIS